jgi:pimeloyl-ACP methyl ester carboxylesterase
VDAITESVFSRLANLQREEQATSPAIEFCEKVWSILREIYVTNPADAVRIEWSRCELPNERAFMRYWLQWLQPSLHRLDITADESCHAAMPVLVVHGTRDRSAPIGGARDWLLQLPDARALAVRDAGHAPWIEAPDLVLPALRTFLDGRWPEAASTDPEVLSS